MRKLGDNSEREGLCGRERAVEKEVELQSAVRGGGAGGGGAGDGRRWRWRWR